MNEKPTRRKFLGLTILGGTVVSLLPSFLITKKYIPKRPDKFIYLNSILVCSDYEFGEHKGELELPEEILVQEKLEKNFKLQTIGYNIIGNSSEDIMSRMK
jgi:hypothetical protein